MAKSKLVRKTLLGFALTAAVLASAPVQAYSLSFGYTANPSDGSGKTSPYLLSTDSTAGIYAKGDSTFFLDTFTLTSGGGGSAAVEAGMATMTAQSPFNQTTGFAFAQGSVSGQYAAPAGDSTYFAYGPATNSGRALVNQGQTDTVTVDFAGLLAANPDTYLNYLGFYYGSIDQYNELSFLGASGQTITITGAQILSTLGGAAGNQTDDKSNVYVNILFDQGDEFKAFNISTWGVAVELDNMVVGIGAKNLIPEPASLALLGLGLAGLGFSRRRKA